MAKITELPQQTFDLVDIDTMVYCNPEVTHRVSLKEIFNSIFETAKNEGLEVELKENRIIFHKNNG